jgi:CheY-like chemotaxis protein
MDGRTITAFRLTFDSGRSCLQENGKLWAPMPNLDILKRRIARVAAQVIPGCQIVFEGTPFAWVRFRIEDRYGNKIAGPSADFHADEIANWNDKELRDVLTALTRKIRVLVVDDHAMVRRGLCTFLTADPEFEVVGEAARGGEALLKAAELQPNVIVLDISLPDMDGLEVARRMRKIAPNSQILLVSEHGNAVMNEAFRAGGCGYLLKSDAALELVIAVRTVNRKQQYISQRFAH